ncbi:MAG TPA: choice-of-anchor D domain-containing protein, partial [Saprospiraceae bacterium]|nr:choice-of-anchor D domain-containing protein [Saprospiraceae bacterium]
MNATIQKTFVACLVTLSFLFFRSDMMAQTVQVSGRCITGTVTLTVDPGSPLNGKVWYSGFGTVLGSPGVNVNIYWDNSVNKWYLDFDGQPYFENSDDTTLPPSTNVATWVPTDDNSDCLTGAPLSIAGNGTGDREINVKQNTTNIADGGSFNFGNVNLGSNSSLPFTIENQGTLTLTLTGTAPNFVTKGGANPGDFTITQPATGTIPAASNTTFTVVFTPGGLGARSCTLQIPNNDANESPYDITLNGTGVCSTPACSITFTNPPPWGQDTACANSTGNVHSAPGGMSAYNWSISGSGTFTSPTNGSSVTVTAGSSGYSLFLTVTDANGCTSTCSDQTPVKGSPTCTLTGPDPVCGNSTGNVYSVNNGSYPISFYSWSISGNGTIVGSTTGSSITVTAGASGTYTVNVTSMGFNFCPSFCSKTVTINSAGSPTITGPTSVCSGGSVMLDAGAGYTTYAWSNGGGSGQ